MASAPVNRARVIHVFTSPMALRFIRGHAAYMREFGFELSAVTSMGSEVSAFEAQEGVPVTPIDMKRSISPIADIVSIYRLVKHLRCARPSIVHAHTPKGGLVGMVSAVLSRTPVRIYHLRGLRYTTSVGLARTVLKSGERISCRLSHRVICVSPSLRDLAVEEKLCPPAKIVVLAGGSGNGVDADGRFDPSNVDPTAREQIRARLVIPADAVVVGFVGRVVRDKGIVELALAWSKLSTEHPGARLLIVGPCEAEDPVPVDTMDKLRADASVVFAGPVQDPAPYYAAMDLLVLPSYREGLPNTPLEAASMRLPVVASRIPGCVDAIADETTGLLVPPRDADALGHAIRRYLDDPDLRSRHGRAGRERARVEFRSERIWEHLRLEYESLLAQR